jgi:hypothetical protein
MNTAIVTAGGSAAKCPARTAWKGTANPTPASMLDGIANNLLQPPYAIDGDDTTRYSSGTPGVGTEWYQIDLGSAAMVSGIIVDVGTGADITDVSNSYKVELSTDATNWTTVATCAYPAQRSETINFAAKSARYIRYDNTSALPMAKWWSIHEIAVICN